VPRLAVAPVAGALGAAQVWACSRRAGLPGALMALVGDLQVLDENLPESDHGFSVDVIVTLA